MNPDQIDEFKARLDLGQDVPGRRPPVVEFTRVLRWTAYDEAYWSEEDLGRYEFVLEDVRLERGPRLFQGASAQ